MLYPQQNLYRNRLDISGIWDFQIDPDQAGESQGWQHGFGHTRPIAVPGSWNEQYADLYNYLGLGWYSKRLYIPQAWKGQRIFLRVGSACYFSTVYLNGIKMGSHEGGHLPFVFELSDCIQWDSENLIIISVENELKPERVPSGNMDTPLLPVASYPKTTYDFFPFAGIHRPVVLYTVPYIFIDDITVVTDIDGADGIVKVTARLNEKISSPGVIQIKSHHELVTVNVDFQDGFTTAVLRIPNAQCWSNKNPYLYDLTVSIEQDCYAIKIGIRTVVVLDGKILLNGEPVQLNGFGRHEDFFASGKGLNLPLLVKDYGLMRWMSANSYRTAHYPYSEEEMQLADQEGFLIINETPAVSLQFEDDTNIDLRLKMCLQQVDELIARDKNHPSVVLWSVANEPMLPRFDGNGQDEKRQAAETKAKHFLGQLMQRARQLDPTRPVTFAHLGGSPTSWFEHCDVLCLNRYWGWYVLGGELERAFAAFGQELDKFWEVWQKPIIVTEFGADTIAGMHGQPNLMWAEEYQAELIRGYLSVAKHKHFVAGMQVWNFADFAAVQSVLRVGGINMKGVFTRQRTPKMAAYALREIWQKP